MGEPGNLREGSIALSCSRALSSTTRHIVSPPQTKAPYIPFLSMDMGDRRYSVSRRKFTPGVFLSCDAFSYSTRGERGTVMMLCIVC